MFRRADAELDKARYGPRWLRGPRVARCVVEAIERGAGVLDQYTLEAFVVMPNHVHLLVEPRIALARIMNGLKGATARKANEILGREGKRFWQSESFDHWVRHAAELDRIRSYIERNPVTAGLAGRPEEWPWSSAARE